MGDGARRDEIRWTADGRGVSRRGLLAALGLGTGAVVLGGCVVTAPAVHPPPPAGEHEGGPFPDGVKAGDPLPDGAVIWTRTTAPADGAPVPVVWSVAAADGPLDGEAGWDELVAGGVVLADAAHGHTVSVRVDGLAPDRWYRYRFEVAPGATSVAGAVSRAGRLRTAPAAGTAADHLRFAFCGDQQINDSWFVAHRAIAREPGLDFFAHLGDYVYVHDVATVTLDDYRGTYRRWHAQPMLRDLHSALPIVATWSDGEFYNGVDRTGPAERIAAAKQAWFEHFPVADDGSRRPERAFGWGSLADVVVLDDRTHRDPTVGGVNRIDGDGLEVHDPTRTALGAEQYAWLTSTLQASTARWRIVAEDYPIAPWRLVNLEFLRPFRPDMPPGAGLYMPAEVWDQYMAQRADLLRSLADHGVADLLFCAAETHISLTSDLRAVPTDPSSPVLAADVTAPSLTADPDVRRAYLPDLPTEVADEVLHLAERWVLSQNAPDMRFMDLVHQGYVVVDADPERIEVTYRFVDTADPDATAVDGARFRLVHGRPGLEVLPVATPMGSLA
ncbi:alkaline phosphatase D family protein [Dermatobacter hominis]|uniref:alkaline phosphatase D family protein n=1 Tax=Dermatobacter hominis TaxID=2884263 RepID=UPI001D120AD2|nr:alkaline phosphatase D family protein [Dermatobacter hominis]UDY37436.1 alkaline phosphatase D family protein [Dermatobacter hominis]